MHILDSAVANRELRVVMKLCYEDMDIFLANIEYNVRIEAVLNCVLCVY